MLFVVVGLLGVFFVVGWIGGLCINMMLSELFGLWCIVLFICFVLFGDMVFVCLFENIVMCEVR